MRLPRPVVDDSVRFLVNVILVVVLIGAVVALAFGVGYWMMGIWHKAG